MLRVLLDSNGIDPIADTPGAIEVVEAAVRRGDLQLLVAASVLDEVAAVPKQDRRARLLDVAAKAELVPDGAFVIGKSRLDHARLGDSDVYEQLKAGNNAHIGDAVIAMAAKVEGAVLVTNDKRLTAKAEKVGMETMTTAALLARIQQ